MKADYSQSTGQIRLYSEGGYEGRSKYDGIVTVHWLTKEHVYLCGALGKIDLGEIATLLKSLGAKRFSMERGGKIIEREFK